MGGTHKFIVVITQQALSVVSIHFNAACSRSSQRARSIDLGPVTYPSFKGTLQMLPSKTERKRKPARQRNCWHWWCVTSSNSTHQLFTNKWWYTEPVNALKQHNRSIFHHFSVTNFICTLGRCDITNDNNSALYITCRRTPPIMFVCLYWLSGTRVIFFLTKSEEVNEGQIHLPSQRQRTLRRAQTNWNHSEHLLW